MKLARDARVKVLVVVPDTGLGARPSLQPKRRCATPLTAGGGVQVLIGAPQMRIARGTRTCLAHCP